MIRFGLDTKLRDSFARRFSDPWQRWWCCRRSLRGLRHSPSARCHRLVSVPPCSISRHWRRRWSHHAGTRTVWPPMGGGGGSHSGTATPMGASRRRHQIDRHARAGVERGRKEARGRLFCLHGEGGREDKRGKKRQCGYSAFHGKSPRVREMGTRGKGDCGKLRINWLSVNCGARPGKKKLACSSR